MREPRRQVLDVAVAAVFTRGHRASAFGGHFLGDFTLGLAAVRGGGKGRVGETRHAVGVGGDQLGLALVPLVEHLLVGQAADQTRVDQAGVFHARHVATLGEHAVEVPDGLLRQREVVGQEAATVLLTEEAVETPLAVVLGADVEQVHHQQVAGLGALHAHGPER